MEAIHHRLHWKALTSELLGADNIVTDRMKESIRETLFKINTVSYTHLTLPTIYSV